MSTNNLPRSAFDTMLRFVKINQYIKLSLLNLNEVEVRQGEIIEISSDGIVFKTVRGIEWIPSSDIYKWEISNDVKRSEIDVTYNSEIDVTNNIVPEQEIEPVVNEVVLPVVQVLSESMTQISNIKLHFTGEPNLTLPEINFNFPSLSKDVQQNDVNRWKNKYDYAIKMNEPTRIQQEVEKVADLADSLQSSILFYLAGLLSNYSGLGLSRTKSYLIKAVEIDQHNQDAYYVLSILSIKEKNWDEAIEYLYWTVSLNGDLDKIEIVKCIGQCVLKLKSDKLPVIGSLIEIELPEDGTRLARMIVALLVSNDVSAYMAALEGNVEKLRQTRVGNDLFLWKGDKISAPITVKLPIMSPKLQGNKNLQERRRGFISVFYAGKNYGFIVEKNTKQTWFFNSNELSDVLLADLHKNNEQFEVTFKGNIGGVYGRYPNAFDIVGVTEESVIVTDEPKRAPLILRLQTIPKDGSLFARAMKAEQLDQLDTAEALYQEQIRVGGKHLKSAIKNLAGLKNRQGQPEIAVALLDKYQNVFDGIEIASLDQMRVQFLVKARNFTKAREILAKLVRQSNGRKKLEFLRQEAYCMLANGDFDEAITKLTAVLKEFPADNASVQLLIKARDAKQTGIVPFDVIPSDGDETISSLALGLSLVARKKLDNCDLRGIDARTRESNDYSESDVRSVEGLLDKLRGRRPRERADYLLTLAWMCENASNVTGNRSIHAFLRRYFTALAEATFNDGSPKDVVRCYCLESLRLCPINFDERDDAKNTFEAAMVLLLGTYLPDSVDSNGLLEQNTGRRLPLVITMLDQFSTGWGDLIKDLRFYNETADVAINHLLSNMKHHIRHGEMSAVIKSNENINRLVHNAFAGWPKNSFSADILRNARQSLTSIKSILTFELDRIRINKIDQILGDAAEYPLERHFREQETRVLRLEADIRPLLEDINRHPTHFSLELFAPHISLLLSLINDDFKQMEESKPVLELRNVLDNDYYVISDGKVALRLLLISKSAGSPPIESIGLMIEYGEVDPCHSSEPLHGGSTREIELTIKPDTKQLEDGAFSVMVYAQYRTRKQNMERSNSFSVAVRLGKPTAEAIINPYGRYSGGTPVEDENMFFGRMMLIHRIVKYVSGTSTGQCFVLYGQKRSGKSSVIKQVEKQLENSVLFVPISAGTFTQGNLWVSFARLFLQELKFRLEDKNIEIIDWPKSDDITNHPLESIRKVMRNLKKMEHFIVVAIDEFTYIYETARDDAGVFMRGWKALLEAKTFNAILIGQDTMPRFKQEFPNEFGVTHDERITYLNEEEASALATNPILLDGLSRYRGQALHRLFELTAGSPYFLQITCDYLVRHLNERKAVFVTEADVDQVARILTIGEQALPPERFDALVTAAGESVAKIPSEDLLKLLGSIARESSYSGFCSKQAVINLPRSSESLKDLTDREILLMEGDKVSIRVGIFSMWLRANQ